MISKIIPKKYSTSWINIQHLSRYFQKIFRKKTYI